MSPTRLDLLQFLKHAVQISRPPRSRPTPIYVLGNPSADLDSIISAILYSYIASTTSEGRGRQYVPVINLADVRSGKELQRLRPEFATALRLATSLPHGKDGNNIEFEDSLLTIADLKERFHSGDKTVHEAKADGSSLDVVMVDWNALPVTSVGGNEAGVVSCEYGGMRMSVSGCIDHHQDEAFIPRSRKAGPHTEPHCIQTGVGSCTSLVVRELRSRDLWTNASQQVEPNNAEDADVPTPKNAKDEAQTAKLALAAILVDTVNMTDENKVSDVDRSAVFFLEEKIQNATPANQSGDTVNKDGCEWDRQSFYEEIVRAKTNSVENLTMDEILGRDYKEWTETSPSNETVKIGFCSIVKPLSWVLRKATQSRQSSSSSHPIRVPPLEFLFHDLLVFSRARQLDIVVVMTAFVGPSPNQEFSRELLVWDINDAHKPQLEHFEAIAIDELGLASWHSDQQDDIVHESTCDTTSSCASGYRRVWKQKDVSKSRKQVAPLMRDVMAGK